MVRFLHSGDWQIGMTRHFLAGEAQARFAAARVDVIRRLGKVAVDQECDFIVVCGDVFESNQLTPQTVRRALEALRQVEVPVYLLPGNHDPLDAMSVYTSEVFRQEAPPQVHVLTPGVHDVGNGVELVAAPWPSKHPGRDLVAASMTELPPGPAPAGVVRVVVGHGAVDVLDPDRHNAAAISTPPLCEALAQGRIHYVALGDRHSRTAVADTPAIHYAGTPEQTTARESGPGDVLVVELEPGAPPRVTPHHVGTWSFLTLDRRVGGDADLASLDDLLTGLPDKDRTVVHYALRGTLTVAQHARLEGILERHRDTLAALVERGRHHDLAIVHDEQEWAELGLGGFLGTAVEEIRGLVDATSPADAGVQEPAAVLQLGESDRGSDAWGEEEPQQRPAFVAGRADDEDSARDALALLYRLSHGGAA